MMYFVAATGLTAFILAGNLMTIIAFSVQSVLRKNPSYWYITSLALADFMVGLSVPSIVYDEVSEDRLSDLECNAILALHLFPIVSTFSHLLIISLDRYFKLMSPLKYMKRMTLNKAFVAIALMWLTSGLTVLFFVIPDHNFGASCLVIFYFAVQSAPPLHLWLFLIVFQYIPFTLLVFCSLRVYLIATRFKHALEQHLQLSELCDVQLRYHSGKLINEPATEFRTTTAATLQPGSQSSVIVCLTSDSETVKVKRLCQWMKAAVKQRKIAILITSITVTTGVCWLGASTAYLMKWFCPSCGLEESWIRFLHPWLLFLNSALNPVLLVAMSDDFRRAYVCLFRPLNACFPRRQRTESLHHQSLKMPFCWTRRQISVVRL